MPDTRPPPQFSLRLRPALARGWAAWRQRLERATIGQLLLANAAGGAIAAAALFVIARLSFSGLTTEHTENNSINDDAGLGRIRYFYWIRSYYFPDHKFTILAFIVAALILAMMAMVSLRALVRARTSTDKLDLVSRAPASLALGLALALCAFARIIPSPIETVGLILVTLALQAVGLRPLRRLRISEAGSQRLAVLLTGIAGAELLAIFVFLGGGFLPLASDYLTIPSTALVRDSASATRAPVDTLQFINQHRLFGNHLVPDPRQYPTVDPPCRPGNVVRLPPSEILNSFVRQHRHKFYLRYPTGELCFVGVLETHLIDQLRATFPDQVDDINLMIALNKTRYIEFARTPLTYEEKDFGRRERAMFINYYHDLERQFHHYMQFLNPIKEYWLGRRIDAINAPYGLSFIVVGKLMKYLGGKSLHALISVTFIFYALYFALLLLIVHRLYRHWPSTFVVAATIAGSVTGLGLVTLATGVGYAPMRHALDLGVIASLAVYLRRDKPIALVIAILLCIANLFLDRTLGGFCGVALAATLILRSCGGLTRRIWPEAVAGGGLMVAIVVGYVMIGRLSAENPFASQFLDGVWGFPIPASTVITYLALISIGLFTTLWSAAAQPSNRKSLPLFLIAYATIFLLYWMIVPNYGHLYKGYPFMAFAAVSIWHECFSASARPAVRRWTVGFAMAFAALFWLDFSRPLAFTSLDAIAYFRGNQRFDWDFPQIKLQSTMDPAPFAAGAKLIADTVPPQDEVSILSEYDSILLLLANRISAMPHFEVGTYLNDPKSFDKVVADLKARRPRILVTDACIQCSAVPLRPGRLVPDLPAVYLERALQKVDRLQLLRFVFARVVGQYELVTSNEMVAVWRLKGS